MSLRAIKKRENHISSNGVTVSSKPSLFRKANLSSQTQQSQYSRNSFKSTAVTLNVNHQRLQRHKHKLLGRFTQSDPDLVTGKRLNPSSHLVRTKSENDVSTLLNNCSENLDISGKGLLGAKSEVSLKTITSHNYCQQELPSSSEKPGPTTSSSIMVGSVTTISTVHSPQNMTQSSCTTSSSSSPGYDSTQSPSRRMSESSIQSRSTYSPRTSAISGSASTLSSSSESNTVMRVPIIGYEVMEERARFTVYKLRVENPATNDCWLVLRRYTDFVRLNTKLKQVFPHISLMLPRKKIFGDNFNSVFLDNRIQGLQIFVNSIMAKEELRKSKFVREFFCLDEPPTYSESMEECRAIFEAQEETISHLKLQISNKNELILNLQQQLRTTIAENESLKEAFKNLSLNAAASTSNKINETNNG